MKLHFTLGEYLFKQHEKVMYNNKINDNDKC